MSENRIQVGQTLPASTLRTLTADGPTPLDVHEYCKGRKLVLFGVPGAFTGTCSKTHLPSFIEHAAAMRAKGVDEIACISVNDVFVLDAWKEATGAGDKVSLLSDGNAEFCQAIGLSFDGSGIGFGIRSLRYSMLVDDGVVQALHVEDSPGACTITAAPTILEAL